MKVLFLNAGNETGGGMYHILRVLKEMNRHKRATCLLGVLEKKALFEKATEAEIETVYFENDTRASIPLLQKIIRYIKQNKITHVHTHGPRANVYMNIMRRKLQVHWIVTVHSDPFFDFKEKGLYGKFLTRLHIQAIKNAQKIILVSEAFHFPLREVGLQKNRVSIIHNGVDFSLSEENTLAHKTRENFGFSQTDFLIVKVARLEYVKGHRIALQAFAQLVKEQQGKCHLLLLGDGQLRASLELFAKELGVDQHVHFYGERIDVSTFYQMADVTLLTSLSESFPYVLLESARARTPIIATDVGDVGKLLATDQLGWKIAVNNVGECVQAMKEAMQLWEQRKLQQYGKNLYIYASLHFSIDKCVNEVYNVYSNMY